MKWNNIFPNLNWRKIFHTCQKTTIDTKLRWFQLRLIYRILPTNRFLSIRKILDNETCDLCRNETETIEHMLYDCTFVTVFWHQLTQKFISKIVHANSLKLSKELVIFGVKENVYSHQIFFLLPAKYYVYSCKFTKSIPNADVFLRIFKYRYLVEKGNNLGNNKFELDWMPNQTLLQFVFKARLYTLIDQFHEFFINF